MEWVRIRRDTGRSVECAAGKLGASRRPSKTRQPPSHLIVILKYLPSASASIQPSGTERRHSAVNFNETLNSRAGLDPRVGKTGWGRDHTGSLKPRGESTLTGLTRYNYRDEQAAGRYPADSLERARTSTGIISTPRTRAAAELSREYCSHGLVSQCSPTTSFSMPDRT
jgi:hypothetical protein